MKPTTTVTSKTVTIRIPITQSRTNSTQLRGNSNDNKNNKCDLQGIGNTNKTKLDLLGQRDEVGSGGPGLGLSIGS